MSSVVERSALPLGSAKTSLSEIHEISPLTTFGRDDNDGLLTFLLIYVNRCTVRECYAVGRVEGFQIDFPKADARFYGYDSTQEFAVIAGVKTGQRQLVPAFLLAQMAHLPDKIIGGLNTEPRLQHVADAEALILTSEEAPCALQPLPEQHKAFLGILNLNHNLQIENDQMTLTK